MELPRIRVVDMKDFGALTDDGYIKNAGVVIDVKGDLECVVTFLINGQLASIIVEDLTGEPVQSLDDMSEMQQSAICEIGNIMCNSYLNALASMLDSMFQCPICAWVRAWIF